jgi:hypothetical protein
MDDNVSLGYLVCNVYSLKFSRICTCDFGTSAIKTNISGVDTWAGWRKRFVSPSQVYGSSSRRQCQRFCSAGDAQCSHYP